MVRDATVTQVPLVRGSGQPPDARVVYTIGHSTRDLDDFLALLDREHIEHLADVRSFPGSRRYPQFGREALAASLAARGIQYSHHPALGGRRHARADSPNGAWRNESFRGYADYMQTPEFAAALDGLLALAERERTVIMCAEAVPWRCHRSMISDALVARGVHVRHILDSRTEPHRMTSFAIVKGGTLYYPPVQTEL